MYWGDPGSTSSFYHPSKRWDSLASALGARVLSHCPRWSIFVQGVGACQEQRAKRPSNERGVQICEHPSATSEQDMTVQAGIWWGENLQAAIAFPVDVGNNRSGIGKIVYSPHTYGPATAPQPQFESQHFPVFN